MSSEATTRRIGSQTEINSLVQWAGLIGIAGPVVFWVVSLTLGIIIPWYSALHNFVSGLSAVGTPYAFIAQLNLYVWGASLIVLALGLHTWSHRGRRPWLGVIVLAAVGVGIIGAGFFQYNPENLAALSTRGHKISTRVVVFSALIGMPLTSWHLNRDERWPGYHHRLLPVGIAVLLVASFITYLTSVPTYPTGLAGLAQRVLFGVMTGWQAYYALTLYRQTRRGSRDP